MRRRLLGIPLAMLLLAGVPSHAPGGDAPAPEVSARSALALADQAAGAWDPLAFLVYLENDETAGADGLSTRWGYLYFSPSRGTARGYSVEDGEIVVAANLDFDLEAPPVPADWIDSDRAVRAAEDRAGRAYREEFGGVLKHLILMRGAFHEQDPDRTTWTVIYGSDTAPSLFVVVDARSGEVRRTWRG